MRSSASKFIGGCLLLISANNYFFDNDGLVFVNAFDTKIKFHRVTTYSPSVASSISLSFLKKKSITSGSTTRLFTSSSSDASSNSNNDKNNNNAEEEEDYNLMKSLMARQREIQNDQNEVEKKWKMADCVSSIPLALPNDWIRRIDVNEYPLVVCGSSSETVYLCNVESGKILAQSSPLSSSLDDDDDEEADEYYDHGKDLPNMKTTLRLLYGNYDGGGTIAIATYGDLICSSGRQGSVQVYRFDPSSPPSKQKLIYQGTMISLKDRLVTTLKLDEDYLWVGTSDGMLYAYSHSSTDNDILPLPLQQEPELTWDFSTKDSSSPITSLSIHNDIGYGVCTTGTGSVELFSLDDDEDSQSLASWLPPLRHPTDNVQSCIIIEQQQKEQENTNKSGDNGGCDDSDNNLNNGNINIVKKKEYSIVCGATDGTIHFQKLNFDDGNFLNEDNPLSSSDYCKSYSVGHTGSIKCLASPLPNLLVTGGLDGTIRVWDIPSPSSISPGSLKLEDTKSEETDKKSNNSSRSKNSSSNNEQQQQQVEKPVCLYQFIGYKVWLGSLHTPNGIRLISDGADNTIVVHDFSKEPSTLQEE